jgi:hypothetical protein
MYSTISIHWNIKSAPASPGRSRVEPLSTYLASWVFSTELVALVLRVQERTVRVQAVPVQSSTKNRFWGWIGQCPETRRKPRAVNHSYQRRLVIFFGHRRILIFCIVQYVHSYKCIQNLLLWRCDKSGKVSTFHGWFFPLRLSYLLPFFFHAKVVTIHYVLSSYIYIYIYVKKW